MAKFDTETPEGIRDQAMARFNEIAAAKYDAGQLEHGGLLSETVTPEKMEEEGIDVFMYAQAWRIKEQGYLKQIAWLNNKIESLKHEIFDYEAGRK